VGSSVLVGFLALGVMILAHTAALFYWGGKTSRLLETHDAEIATLRLWKHDEVTQQLTALQVDVGVLREQIADLQRREGGQS
jgi:hypothetical protein